MAFGKRFLVWDSFRCHISDEMKETARKRKTVMGVIPGGCTKFLQPLDVSINKPFKAALNGNDEWFRKGELEYTSGGMQKPPNHVLQVQWVVEAWKQIDKEIIKKSFDTCGITTSDPDKIHCLGKGQPTEEVRVLLGESNPSIEFVPRPTLKDNFQEETDIYNIHNLDDLTDKILEQSEEEIVMI